MEHNEPWRVVTSEPCIGIWQGDYCIADLTDMNIPWEEKVAIANRVVLEHDACAGMSDEEVAELQEWRNERTLVAVGVEALQTRLDEAVRLLEKIPKGWDNPDFWITEREVNDVRDFLDKHEHTP